MSSPDSFQISITSANTSTTATNTTTENTPQKLGDDLRPCLKHKTLLNRNYFKSSSNFSKQVSDCKHEQNFQEQPAYLTKENLQLHNENINLEMKKNLLSLNQPAYNNINLLSRSFPINLQHEKNMTYLGVCNLKNSKHKTNKVSVQSCLPAEKKYENAFDHKSNSIKNKTTDNLCEKLHIENKERNWEENVPPIKNTDYKKENTCEKHLITSCNCNNIYDYDEKTQCSLPHNDSIGRAEQTYLDNTKGYLNACDFHHQKQRKKLNLLKSGFLTNTGVKRDSDILEKNFEVKTNAQKLPVDRKTIAELSDRSHMKALRENYEIKTSDDKSNNNNKNSYYKHEVSRGITVNRERRQHNSDNNNVINADNILIQSSDTCETLKDKAEISLNNNQDIEEYFGIFQLSNNNNQQETLISQRKLDLLKDLSSQKLNTKLRFKPKSVPKIYDNCNQNSNHDYRSFPCVKNLVKMYNKKLEEKKNEKFALNNIANNSDNENTNEMTTENLENRISPVSADEGCQIGRLSCSDSEEAILKSYKKKSDKVIRSSSHDSALGLEEEVAAISFDERRKSIDSIVPIGKSFYKKNILERRNTLTITDIPLRSALLPLPQPVDLPDTTSNTNMENDKEKQQQKTQQQTQNSIPSKVLIEERIVEVPLEMALLNTSRRESAQSCSSEYTNSSEYGAKRYVRTPSVVVSDYSDDVMCGITLEEIEYLRKQRMRRRSSDETATTEKDDALSDVSGASSCSNLYYCGSTISALDGADCYINGIRTKIRKNSDCSICSNSSQASYDEDEEDTGADYNNSEDVFHIENITNNNHERDTQPRKKPSGWRKIRNIVQWTPFFQTYKKQRYPWVQLAGHQGNFKAGPEQGTVLKKLCPKEDFCFQVLMKDVLRPYVPEYKGQVTSEEGELFLQLQDLLSDFNQPCVMDCKIGVRTYLEEELLKAKEKPKLRKDMYEKMIQIDPCAPSEEEHKAKGVTKPRYMVWRETISSTATLGFRIEGIKKSDGTSSKDFKQTKSKDQIQAAFKEFVENFPHSIPRYLQRLRAIRATLECSDFFRTHEVIGSSLLFVHDEKQASVWLIDFAKTVPLPLNYEIDHNTKWIVGNREDGYLIGINNLIDIFMELHKEFENNVSLTNNTST